MIQLVKTQNPHWSDSMPNCTDASERMHSFSIASEKYHVAHYLSFPQEKLHWKNKNKHMALNGTANFYVTYK